MIGHQSGLFFIYMSLLELAFTACKMPTASKIIGSMLTHQAPPKPIDITPPNTLLKTRLYVYALFSIQQCIQYEAVSVATFQFAIAIA
jgi:hypothetical protein